MNNNSNKLSVEVVEELNLKQHLDPQVIRDELHEKISYYHNREVTVTPSMIRNATLMKLNKLLLENVMINRLGSTYIKDRNGFYKLLSKEREDFFNSFTDIYSMYDFTAPLREIQKRVEDLYLKLSNLDLDDSIVCFNNCYFKNGIFYNDLQLKGVPNFVINHTFDERKIDNLSSFFKLISFISDGEKELENIIINSLSLSLLRTTQYRKKYGKLVRLFGATGGNGKSTFLDLISNVFGRENTTSFMMSKLDDDSVIFSIKNSLIAIDYDSPSKYIDDLATANFKKIITADTLSARKLYNQKVNNFCVLSTLWLASNHNFESYDKTDSITRRLLPITIHKKLTLSQQEHENLFSKESVESILNFLITRAIDISVDPDKHLNVKSEKLDRELKAISNHNNNVLDFIDSLESPLDHIDGFSVKHVRSLYEKWCDDNVEVPLKNSNFNSTLTSMLGVKKSSLRFFNTKDFEVLSQEIEKSTIENRVVKVWIKS